MEQIDREFFIVQHRASGVVLSQEFVKGGTYWEPDSSWLKPHYFSPPRLFVSKQAAQNFVTAWVRGEAFPLTDTEVNEFTGRHYTVVTGIGFKKERERSRDELVVIMVRLSTGVVSDGSKANPSSTNREDEQSS